MNRFLLIFLTVLNSIFSESFVTYEFSGGRFGDCLLSFLHAKWLSYKYQMPLLYKPFEYSSELKLDDLEQRYHSSYRPVRLTAKQPYPDHYPKSFSCVYVCPYFAEDPSDRWLNPSAYRFDIDWKDEEFRKIARQMIAPKKDLLLAYLPENTVNIAIHIREGGGYDTDHTRLWDPLKLPPLGFYIEGLNRVLNYFQGRRIYCRIFTDALNPGLLVEELKKSVLPGIQFETREKNNHHSSNVLEDFFSMFQFDVLIHPQSNYSIIPSFLGDYAITFSPYNFKREGIRITITETVLEWNEDLYREVLRRTHPYVRNNN